MHKIPFCMFTLINGIIPSNANGNMNIASFSFNYIVNVTRNICVIILYSRPVYVVFKSIYIRTSI